MRFDLALLFLALATTATSRVIGGLDSVKADSKAGRALMSKARRLNDEEDVDYSWLPGYSFKFEKCYSWDAFGREERNRQESYVVFRACPQGSCSSSCRYGAEYIVEMREYVEAYTQAKQNLQEYNCQQVEDNCACDDDQVDDNTCLSNCYAAAGLNYCQNNENGNNNNNQNNNENMFEEYGECKELEMNNDDDANNAVYYASMYCANGGQSIHLGVFTDEECTVPDKSNAYKKYYGYSLPYSHKSIIGSGCVSCMNPYYEENDDDANNNDEDQVNEMCMELYEQAGKCETNLKIDYPTTTACNYIHNVVPSLEKLFDGTKMAPTSTLTVFFGLMCGVLLGVCYYLFKHQKTTNINLSDQGGVLT